MPSIEEDIAREPFGPLPGGKAACEMIGIKARVERMAQFLRDEPNAQIVIDPSFVFMLHRHLNKP